MELCKARYYHIFAVYNGEFMHGFYKFFNYMVVSVDISVKRKIPDALLNLNPGHSIACQLT